MFDQLNSQQYKALIEIENPVLILAGAGSGKTRLITYKIIYLIKEKQFNPWNILAVTFTNKAANEMKNRVLELLEKKNNNNNSLWISTFHSACTRILRQEIDKINYKNNFSIYDGNDQNRLIKDVIKTYKLESPTEKIIQISAYISQVKNNFESPDQIIIKGKELASPFIEKVGYIYKYYEKQLLENNALDFDDLILKTILLFEKKEAILNTYKERFQYIMVDEFQDTSYCQYRLIKLLTKKRQCISVVGDDDQSIYSWRGADISNISNFSKDFKNCKIIKLEQNYRSTNNILNAAHSVVKRNSNRLKKKLWSEKEIGDKLYYFSAIDDRSEGNWVINKIKSLYEKKGLKLKNFAILYRMNHQSRIFEETLRREGIPYKIFGSIQFYERMEIKDLLAYLMIISNTNDNLALKRVFNVPRKGIGATSIQKIEKIAIELTLSFKKSIIYCIENKIIKNPIKDKLIKLFQWLDKIKKNIIISELLNQIITDIDYLNYLRKNYDHYEERLENITELKRAILEYEQNNINPSLDDFLAQITLKNPVEQIEESENFVSLMTLHNSKGLEFNIIFIIGLGEGIFPHYQALNNEKELQEERRLFYVGVTRAKKKCFLTSASRQLHFGQIRYFSPSSFIKEINKKYLDENKEEEKYKHNNYLNLNNFNEKNINQINTVEEKNKITQANQLNLNQIVYHKSFGKGTVEKINNKGSMSTVLINFSDAKRLLIIKYACLSTTK